MKTTFSLLTALLAPAAALTAQQASAPGKAPTKRVAFAQSCFWTGEMKLGQIEGVMRTEAGFIGGREVTLVEYASEQLALEELARRAKQAGVADLVYLEPGAARSVAGVAAGPPLDRTYRTAPTSDQKKQIQGTPFAKLPLSAAQATKGECVRATESGESIGVAHPGAAGANQRREVVAVEAEPGAGSGGWQKNLE